MWLIDNNTKQIKKIAWKNIYLQKDYKKNMLYLDLANFDYIKHVFPINMEINGRDLTNFITLS